MVVILTEKTFKRILSYFDKHFWSSKRNETNWQYYGLILDSYFDDSILCIDYLDISEYFEVNGSFTFADDKTMSEQYVNLSENKWLLLLQNILKILNCTHTNQDESKKMIKVVTSVLNREGVKVEIGEIDNILVLQDDIYDNTGSYCVILKQDEGILKKKLRDEYKNDQKQQKRLKYEFEMLQKLSDCPYILNVLSYDDQEYSYMMEEGEKNLNQYLMENIELSKDEKYKVIHDILLGMSYAHKNKIIHRDLHLGNILKFGQDFVISDFGLGKDFSINRSLKSSYSPKTTIFLLILKLIMILQNWTIKAIFIQ